jgi:hypothetical protein
MYKKRALEPKQKTQSIEKYRASSVLILSGGFKNIVEAKCYHGLLVLASLKGWKYDSKGEMRVGIGELHRLTKHACENWSEYLFALRRIKDTARLDWGHLSRVVGGFNRVGDVNILSEVRADMDLAGHFQEIVFRIPAALLEDVIKPRWFGQVNPEILFSIKSNYAFNAYLFACLTVIEKDKSKEVFWSDARPIKEWAELLGAEEMPAWRFKQDIFKRTEINIEKATRNTDEPIGIEFTDSETSRGLYQMKVTRLKKRIDAPKVSPKKQFEQEQEAKRIAEYELAKTQERQAILEALKKHPRGQEILDKVGDDLNGLTVRLVCDKLRIDHSFLALIC